MKTTIKNNISLMLSRALHPLSHKNEVTGLRDKQFVYIDIAVLLVVGTAIYLAVIIGTEATTPPRQNAVATQGANNGSFTSTLAIAAIKAHPTPGGTIQITQNLPSRGECQDSVISYPSDGLTLLALMERPTTAPPAYGFPVVIYDHGSVPPTQWSVKNTSGQNYIDGLCAAGYLVLRPDYRGYGTSPGTPSVAAIYPDAVYDNLNLIHSVHNLSYADPNAIGVAGHSTGGGVALRTIVVDPDIKASAIISGVSSTMQNLLYSWSPNTVLPEYKAQVSNVVTLMGGTPQQKPTAWHDASAINYLSAITGPVQVDAGTADKTVPYQWSQQLDAALGQANIQHTLVSYPGADHNYTNTSDRALLTQNLVAFFTKNLHSE